LMHNRIVERRRHGTVVWSGRAARMVSALPPGITLDDDLELVPVWDRAAARETEQKNQED